MTPEEQVFFSQLGSRILKDICRPIAGSAFFGISVGLCAYAAYLLRTRRLRGRPAWIILSTAFVCFLLTTANFAAITSTSTTELQIIQESGPPGVSGILTLEDDKNIGKANSTYFVTQYIILYVSDTILIWRTCALYPDRPHLFWLPGILSVASIVCLIVGFTLPKGVPVGWPSTHVLSVGRAVDDVGQVLSVLTNLWTTACVAIRLWVHRRWFIRQTTGESYTPIQKKLLVLVETGALFCVVQIISVGLAITIDIIASTGRTCSTLCTTTEWIISRFRFAFAANYSILVLVLVYSKKSFIDAYYISGQ